MGRYSAAGVKLINAVRTGTTGFVGTVVRVSYLTGSSTFTPLAGTHAMIVHGCGGGGAGGGAPTTVDSAGGGGNAGAEFTCFLTSIQTSYSIIAGAGGAGSAGAAGATGNQTQIFGVADATNPIGSALGGSGGIAGSTSAAPRVTGNNVVGANFPITHDFGNGARPGKSGKNRTATVVKSGAGASCGVLGTGGGPRITDGVGIAATGFGSGGGGARSVAAGTSRAGGAGSAGVIVIIELK